MKPIYHCDSCFDRGFWILYRNGNKMSFGERTEYPCPHCKGNWVDQTRGIDQELRDLLAWFRTSKPPANPFRLNRYKTVENPELYWKNLQSQISQDNVYVLERVRDDLVCLRALFEGEDF